MQLGQMHMSQTKSLLNPLFIINFPTVEVTARSQLLHWDLGVQYYLSQELMFCGLGRRLATNGFIIVDLGHVTLAGLGWFRNSWISPAHMGGCDVLSAKEEGRRKS